MDISQAIVEAGTDAVLRYGTVAGLQQDNRIPEIFLGGFIACGIYYKLGLHAHVEHPYTVIANKLGTPITPDLLLLMEGYKADVAVYADTTPMAVVELKVFDDGKRIASIAADRDKMRKLTERCRVEAYLGILITDVSSGQTCSQRIRLLSECLGSEFNRVGENQHSIDGAWEWCFASTRVA